MKKASPYIPGLLLFLFAAVISLLTYQDYGIAWDEPAQREIGTVNYNYVFNNDHTLIDMGTYDHGSAFELTLLIVEKAMHITDSRDLYLMRHLVSNLFFLVSALFGYVLVYRLFGSRWLACLGFIMLAFAPRIYAHSFFNSKDVPFLAMVIVIFTLCQLAFSKNKPLYFALLGAAVGYATAIRAMGIMYACIILLFLVIDITTHVINKQKLAKQLVNMAAFILSFCLVLYISWPYLWRAPLHNFIDSYHSLSHFFWTGTVLFQGKILHSEQIPWTYIPIWFLISNPPVWLITGFGGVIWVACTIIMRPMRYITNTPNRHFLLYIICFFAPVVAIIALRSVVYDDWRHLYFVYPPFVMLALYCIDRLVRSGTGLIVVAACMVQVVFIGYFMVSCHPFQQVYFNAFISHKPEYLRNNYDMEYWGCSYKQALEHLIRAQPAGLIRIDDDKSPLENNLLILPPRDRSRIVIDGQTPDYKITNFRMHPANYPYPAVTYTIKELNSTILCVYKTHN